MSGETDLSWFPVFGEFDLSKTGEVTFVGRWVPAPAAGAPSGDTAPKPAFGLLLSNKALADGELSVDVVFDEVTADTKFELVTAYDANASHLVAVGLGGDSNQMCAVREFGGPQAPNNWWYLRSWGDRSGLRAKVVHKLNASFRGSVINVRVDGVNVATVSVTTPTGARRQVGLFCAGTSRMTATNLRIEPSKPQAFIVMQFGAQFDDIYAHVVKEVCKDYDVKELRGDEVTGPGLIISDIIREITAAQLIIADITPVNANVYFEVGYAFALNKPTILLARKGTVLPFDVSGFRVLFYEDSIGGKVKLEEALKKHLDAILNANP